MHEYGMMLQGLSSSQDKKGRKKVRGIGSAEGRITWKASQLEARGYNPHLCGSSSPCPSLSRIHHSVYAAPCHPTQIRLDAGLPVTITAGNWETVGDIRLYGAVSTRRGREGSCPLEISLCGDVPSLRVPLSRAQKTTFVLHPLVRNFGCNGEFRVIAFSADDNPEFQISSWNCARFSFRTSSSSGHFHCQ